MIRHGRWTLIAAFAVASLVGALAAGAEVRLNGMFVDGAVLQRGMQIPVWGTARSGEKVSVALDGRSASTAASDDGTWMVRLPAMKAGGPYTMTVTGDNRIEVKNVLIGEVWICSGQSNMQFPLSMAHNAAEVIPESGDPMLRLCTIPRGPATTPQSDVTTQWVECSPTTVPGFTAVGYFFGRDLRRALKVPVGLISTNYGGTPAEAWTSRGTLAADPDLRWYLDRQERALETYPKTVEAYKRQSAAYQAAGSVGKEPRVPGDPAKSPSQPSGLYNAMIAPLVPYGIRGAIWYQGESNAGQAWLYRDLMPSMIQDWRDRWGEGDFTFLMVQLAPFMKIQPEPTESAWAELCEAQLRTSRLLPMTGMAVITDVGDENDIHPRHKEPVGDRLALLARKIAYGEKIDANGPVYVGCRFDAGKAVVTFSDVDGGLVSSGGPLKGFALAGADRKFVWADATVHGNTVVVSTPAVPQPVALRFGWADYPVVNLFNRKGLPASPFRTDNFPMVTAPKASSAK